MAPEKLLAEWFWIDRWMGSSAFLLPVEARGLYREMLSQAWRRGARLPNDHDAIQRAVGCTKKEWARGWLLIAKYWRVDGDYLVNDTQQEIYAATLALTQARSRAGKLGNASRWGRTPGRTDIANAVANDIAPPVANPSPPSPSPSPIVVPSELHKELVIVGTAEALDLRAGHLVERYAELFYLHRHGARYRSRIHLDFQKAQELVRTWPDDARLEKLAIIVLESDDEWIARTDRGFGVFAAKASWADDRLVAWERDHLKKATN